MSTTARVLPDLTDPSVPVVTEEQAGRSSLHNHRLLEAVRCVHGSRQFLSFGTQDLTQMTWGRSRDDAESSSLPHYLDTSVVRSSLFQTIEVYGVLAGGDCSGASTCRPPGHRAGRVWRARW